MSNELQIVDESTISVEVKAEINEDIERIIAAHKNNRQAINKLVFESIAVMTEADDAQAELSNKGWLKRRIGSITGSNSRLQDRINSNRATAMYASQRTLQKLAEQNLMTFDLIAAVNNKLNASLIKVDEEFENIYKGLAKFFKTNRSELARIEARLEKVERNVGLLNWQTSIEYQEFEGVEYADLDDVTKIVCLVRDFYDITKGEWSNSDLLILKSAMRDIDISPKDTVNYFGVMKGISYNETLKEYMLNGNAIMQIEDPSYLLSLGCIKKFESLNNEENYLVDTIAEYMDNNGITKERDVICSDLTSKYLANKAYVNVDIEVDCYDLVLDLLYNIKQAKEEKLLLICGMENELGAVKDEPDVVVEESEIVAQTQQLYLLGKQYYNGDGVECDYAKAYEYYQKAADLGNGDAMNAIGDLYYLGKGLEQDYVKAMLWYLRASEFDNSEAMNSIGDLYSLGDGVEYDELKAKEWYLKAAELGNSDAMNNIGDLYFYGDNPQEDFPKALKWYLKAVELGNGSAAKNIGDLYRNGYGVEKSIKDAMKWYSKAVELGNKDAEAKIKAVEEKGEVRDSEISKYVETKSGFGALMDIMYRING